jgi:hypothetical protein
MASFIPSRRRSAVSRTSEPAGTAITSLLVANSTGFESRPSAWSSSGIEVFAEARTSGFTPCRI